MEWTGCESTCMADGYSCSLSGTANLFGLFLCNRHAQVLFVRFIRGHDEDAYDLIAEWRRFNRKVA